MENPLETEVHAEKTITDGNQAEATSSLEPQPRKTLQKKPLKVKLMRGHHFYEVPEGQGPSRRRP